MQLRRQPSRGVRQHDVRAAGHRGIDRVEDHGRRIAGLLGDARSTWLRSPHDGELLARRGAERVAGGEQHGFAVALEIVGELADGSGLAAAIDAREHDHERAVGLHGERHGDRLEQLEQRLLQRLSQLGGIGVSLAPRALPQLAEQMGARGNADIRADQRRFQLLVECLVERARRPQQPGQAVAELVARLGKPVPQAREPAAALGGRNFRT